MIPMQKLRDIQDSLRETPSAYADTSRVAALVIDGFDALADAQKELADKIDAINNQLRALFDRTGP